MVIWNVKFSGNRGVRVYECREKGNLKGLHLFAPAYALILTAPHPPPTHLLSDTKHLAFAYSVTYCTLKVPINNSFLFHPKDMHTTAEVTVCSHINVVLQGSEQKNVSTVLLYTNHILLVL